ncbi:inorganic diphosphatase [Thecamonas trahens ATCC 50062]|uniref:inorganic diphosphatase n=1 Tax=Thecamonas trahens ATCC 50062 TaxID=461836 RepID=A0A0L0DEW7_THETB|nr:inorganic diphosphatase [Thecamonas trahens ATCC 50062]KNC50834.1 inorganic diphosphatase [Thecamonas trahens ATCC 50062]|eukprot:XP_013756789.1 inorganic diphosphatase [Thecamonas trahens ATCC 50062]
MLTTARIAVLRTIRPTIALCGSRNIPRGLTVKMEVATDVAGNPISPDTNSDGSVRHLKYKNGVMGFNYGAIPRTWEDPEVSYHGYAGDNDPLDVVELSDGALPLGAVVPARVLGVLGLVDEGELDYKVITLRASEAARRGWSDIDDVPAEVQADIIDWYRNYKTAEGKPVNELLWDGTIRDAAAALDIVRHTADAYAGLRADPERATRLGLAL